MNALRDWRFRLAAGSALVCLVGIVLELRLLGIVGVVGYIIGTVLFVRRFPL